MASGNRPDEGVSTLWYGGTAFLRNKFWGLGWSAVLGLATRVVTSTFRAIELGALYLLDETMPGKPDYRAYETESVREKTDRYKFTEKNVLAADHASEDTTSRTLSAIMCPVAVLRVKRENFWIRTLLFADMGFAESFMLGEVECDNLTAFFQLFLANRNQMGNAQTLTSTISSTIAYLARSTNTLSNSLLNVSAHYDISNNMFKAFLSPDMTYSCPIWAKAEDGKADETLERAQMRKLRYIIGAAKIKQADHVLEIGTGWGSFAIEAVRTTGCRVTTLTLSAEQKVLADERISKAGFADRIQVLLMDYRELPSPEKPYDKIVSIEMLEAVGKEFLGTYFSRVHQLLKPVGGIAVLQSITMPEGRYSAYARSQDFINRYVFPGGHLPSITQIMNHITEESKGTLITESVLNIGGHYVRTLRLWRETFLAKFQSDIRPALQEKHSDMTEEEMEVFRRKWEYYFAYSEAGFITKTLGDVIITVGRECTLEFMEDVPL